MGLLRSLKTARRGANKAATDARKAVDELRDLRLRLLGERDDILGRPLPLVEAQDAAAQAVQREADRALSDINMTPLRRPADGRTPRLDLGERDVAALAFAANAEAISDLIRAQVADKYQGGPEPMAAPDRDAEIARLDKELLSVELAEEGVLRQLEGSGFAMARRVDADARALLAHDDELK
tara:strand:+ start:683 stop:1228 length:546 start_codon:yes stop_codon:yes gene_type:complete